MEIIAGRDPETCVHAGASLYECAYNMCVCVCVCVCVCMFVCVCMRMYMSVCIYARMHLLYARTQKNTTQKQ